MTYDIHKFILENKEELIKNLHPMRDIVKLEPYYRSKELSTLFTRFIKDYILINTREFIFDHSSDISYDDIMNVVTYEMLEHFLPDLYDLNFWRKSNA